MIIQRLFSKKDSNKTRNSVIAGSGLIGIDAALSNLNNKNVEAKAASPYAVYDYFQRNKMEVKVLNNAASKLITLGRSWEFSDDFKANVDNKIEIKWTEY